MDFAPYQSSPPESSRPFSPPSGTTSPRASADRARPGSDVDNNNRFSPVLQHPQPQRANPAGTWHANLAGTSSSPLHDGGGGRRGFYHREGVSEFDTTLGIRLDYEACLAYLLLPPVGSIFFLVAERNSDYVRFHAWQSSLLFTCMLVLHVLVLWSSFLSWLALLADVVLMAGLALRAYRDADTLDRFEVPVVGRIASRFLDDE